MGPDHLQAELVELSLDGEDDLFWQFHFINTTMGRTGKVPQ